MLQPKQWLLVLLEPAYLAVHLCLSCLMGTRGCSSAVIVNLGEGIYTRSQLKAASKGRPSIGILLLSNVALVAVSSTGTTRARQQPANAVTVGW